LVCVCGLKENYADCCEPFHSGVALPETAELLMRSRYSAYALRLIDYLIATHHPRQHKPQERAEVQASAEAVVFYRLEIISSSQGQANDKTGKVEFKAYYRQDRQTGIIHEHSRFRRYQGRWVYWDGVQIS
jgi:SEC-C motif domain protein